LPAVVRLAEITEEHDFVQSFITIGTQVRKNKGILKTSLYKLSSSLEGVSHGLQI